MEKKTVKYGRYHTVTEEVTPSSRFGDLDIRDMAYRQAKTLYAGKETFHKLTNYDEEEVKSQLSNFGSACRVLPSSVPQCLLFNNHFRNYR
tara:strand:- start:124 stop:396 length:273 start_codon:yes stop_codon:yes gene_type:complete